MMSSRYNRVNDGQKYSHLLYNVGELFRPCSSLRSRSRSACVASILAGMKHTLFSSSTFAFCKNLASFSFFFFSQVATCRPRDQKLAICAQITACALCTCCATAAIKPLRTIVSSSSF